MNLLAFNKLENSMNKTLSQMINTTPNKANTSVANKKFYCDHCKTPGHTISRCYKINGYPNKVKKVAAMASLYYTISDNFMPLTLHASDITNAFDKGIVTSHNLEQEFTPSCHLGSMHLILPMNMIIHSS